MDPLPDRVETVAALDDHLPGIGAFSTLCVYPFADISGPGWDEAAPLTPVGEYANSCVGREHVFQHSSECYGGNPSTTPPPWSISSGRATP